MAIKASKSVLETETVKGCEETENIRKIKNAICIKKNFFLPKVSSGFIVTHNFRSFSSPSKLFISSAILRGLLKWVLTIIPFPCQLPAEAQEAPRATTKAACATSCCFPNSLAPGCQVSEGFSEFSVSPGT